MSDNEDDHNEGGPGKKRKIQRACDICRRKKIRCDGGQTAGNTCSNCASFNYECTYLEAARKRGPPKGYVEGLENRLEKMEQLLQRLMPGTDLAKEIGTFDRSTWTFDKPIPASLLQRKDLALTSPLSSDPDNTPNKRSMSEITSEYLRQMPNARNSDLIARERREGIDEDDHVSLLDDFQHLDMTTPITQRDFRFFGKSSGAMLVRTALDLKNYYRSKPPSTIIPESKFHIRPEFWDISAWERSVTSIEKSFEFAFPPPDLMADLVQLYFENINFYFPLLHRPTLEKNIQEGLHYEDDMFASVLLLVCAIGSKWSKDERVYLDGKGEGEMANSSGWTWFDQVHLVRKNFMEPPALYDLQFYCLSVFFLSSTSVPQASWTMLGIGIRLAQDMGAHRRRKHPGLIPSAHDELLKRAVWVLICMDRLMSAALGRSCAFQDEDYDLEPPMEVDDEWWDHPDPAKAWRQPAGTQSKITYFNVFINLMQLLAFCLRSIYSINKSKVLLGFVGPQWDRHIVSELDSALNRWIDAVPEYLRWDPSSSSSQASEAFLGQSVSLYSHYYYVQILVHRPFIPKPQKLAKHLKEGSYHFPFPSLAICTNAARSATHILDVYRKKVGGLPPFTEFVTFTAGIVLLLNLWGGKRQGISLDTNRDMKEVHKCMNGLREIESRWHSAGRLWDILAELASVGDLPLPPSGTESSVSSPSPSVDSVVSPPPSTTSSTLPPPIPSSSTGGVGGGGRAIAGNRRVSGMPAVPPSMQPPPPSLQPSMHHPYPHQQQDLQHQIHHRMTSLPAYTEELGRLPLFGGVHFASDAPVPNYLNAVPPPPSLPSHSLPNAQQQGYGGMDGNGGGGDYYGYQHQPYGSGVDYGTAMNDAGVGAGGVGGDMMQGQQNIPTTVDSDTYAMWTSAPSGFELEDWNVYLSSVNEMTHQHGGQNASGSSGGGMG